MKAFDGHQRFVSEGEKKNNIHQKKCYWIKSWSSKISKTRPRVDVIFGRRIFAGKAGHWWSETYLSAKTSKKNWRNKNSDKLPPNALKLQVPIPTKNTYGVLHAFFGGFFGHFKKWAQATGRKVIGVERDHHQILGLVSWNLFRTWKNHMLAGFPWSKKIEKKMVKKIHVADDKKTSHLFGNVGSQTLHGKSSCTEKRMKSERTFGASNPTKKFLAELDALPFGQRETRSWHYMNHEIQNSYLSIFFKAPSDASILPFLSPTHDCQPIYNCKVGPKTNYK